MAKVTKTTTTIEEVPSGGAEPLPFYQRPFWDIIGNLTPEEWGTADNPKHKVRVYRATEQWTNDVAPEGNVLQGPFDEDTIRAKWGGGRYLLWLFGPPDARKVVIRPHQLALEGPPKYAHHAANGNGNGSNPELTMLIGELLAEVRAGRGADVQTKAMNNALDIQVTALKKTAEAVSAVTAPGTPGTPAPKTRMEQLLDKLFEVTLMRMLEPQKPDAMSDKIMTVMMERMLNPANPLDQAKSIIVAVRDLVGPAGGGKTDIGSLASSFLATLPSLADKALEGVREYRLANEAAERTFKLQKGDKVIDVAPNTQPATTTAAPAAAATAEPEKPAAVQEVVGGPSIEWIQLKMVEAIEKDAEAAGEWLFDWLEHIAPELNKQLGPMTAEQIRAIFEAQPILAKVAKHPKLDKVIADYMNAAKEAAKSAPS